MFKFEEEEGDKKEKGERKKGAGVGGGGAVHLSQVQEVCKWAYLHSLELRFHGSLSSLGVPCDQTKGLTLLPANAGLIWWCSAAAGIPHPASSRILVLTGTKPLLEPPGRNSRAT